MKNVLIITYYWPPSGGGGVQRWLKFSKYLPDYGWQCTVCTPENPSFDQIDPSLEDEIHAGTEVLKLPIWEPYSLFKKIRGEKKLDQGVTPAKAGWFTKFIRGNIFIPDPRRFWIRPASKFLESYLRERPVDIIVTTGPPHSMHLIGRKLHTKLGIPWIADFRDPWSRWDMLDEFGLTSFARRIHNRLEKVVISNASGVLTVSQQWAKELKKDHNISPEVIINGFDENDFSGIGDKFPESFSVVHAGLLNRFRDVPVLWRSFARFNERSAQKVNLTLRGMTDPEVVSGIIGAMGKQFIDFNRSIPHNQIPELYAGSFILLLLMNQSKNASGHIPGKFFEYIASNRWILAIGDPDGDAARILNETGHGEVVHWNDAQGQFDLLTRYSDYYSKGIYPKKTDLSKYTRKQLTGSLARYLEEVAFPDQV